VIFSIKNSDSRLDIVVSKFGTKNVSVTVSNLNTDNYRDIVVTNYGSNNVVVLLGYADETFGNETFYTMDFNPHSYPVTIGDFNNDGSNDIAV